MRAHDNYEIDDLFLEESNYEDFIKACRNQDWGFAGAILHYIDVNVKDDVESLLHVIANCNWMPMCQIALDLGANIEAKNLWKRTALHEAAIYGNAEICAALLQHGANPKVKDAHNQTPLDYAIEENHINIITLLEKTNE